MLLGETTGLRVQVTAASLGAANVRIQGLRGRYSQLLADGLPLYGAAGGSADVSWAAGPFEVSGTVFGSRVREPIQLVDIGTGGNTQAAAMAVRGAEPFWRWSRMPTLRPPNSTLRLPTADRFR